MIDITLITGNLGKLAEIKRYLGLPIAHIALDLKEIQSLGLEEIVQDKAQQAFAKINKPVLVEDVSLIFKALGNLPGPLIKWFEIELGNAGLCNLLDTKKSRECIATVCYCFYDGKTFFCASGSISGSVAQSPRGERSFGWGPIFVPVGMSKTLAELSEEEQESVAMRKIALGKLREYLTRPEAI